MRFSTSPLVITILGSTTVWAQNGPLPEYGIGDAGGGVSYDPDLLLGSPYADSAISGDAYNVPPADSGAVDYGALGGGASYDDSTLPYVDLNQADQGYVPVTDPAPISYAADPAPAYGAGSYSDGASAAAVYGDASAPVYGETYGAADSYAASPDVYAAPSQVDYGQQASYDTGAVTYAADPVYDAAPAYQSTQTYDAAPSYAPEPVYQPSLAYDPYSINAASAGYSAGEVFVDAAAMATRSGVTTMHGMGIAPPVVVDHAASAYAASAPAYGSSLTNTSVAFADGAVSYDPAPSYAPLPSPAPVYDPAPVYAPMPVPAPVYSAGVVYDSAPSGGVVYESAPAYGVSYDTAPVYADATTYAPATVYSTEPQYPSAPIYAPTVYDPQPYQPVAQPVDYGVAQASGGFYGQVYGGGSFGQDLEGGGVSFNVDDGWTAGAVIGYETRFAGVGPQDQVRYGIEYQHTASDINGVTVHGVSGNRGFSADVDAVYLRAEYAPDLGGPVRPYVGGAIGYGTVDVGGGLGSESGVFAKGIAGLEVAVAPNVDVFAEYNYVVGPELDFRGGAGAPYFGSADLDYTGHQVMGGIRFTF